MTTSEILVVASAAIPIVLIVAKVIAKRTKTPIDDEIVETVEDIIEEVKHAKTDSAKSTRK